MNRKNFTLMELVLVAVTLSLLGATMIHAVDNARNQSAVVGCADNLRKIGAACAKYSADKGGWILPSHDGRYANAGILYSGKYLTDTKLYKCPSAIPGRNGNGSIKAPCGAWQVRMPRWFCTTETIVLSYGTNYGVCGAKGYGNILKQSTFKKPAITVMWAEARNDGDYAFFSQSFRASCAMTNRAAYRHDMSLNMLMLGGNVVNGKASEDLGTDAKYVWFPGSKFNK